MEYQMRREGGSDIKMFLFLSWYLASDSVKLFHISVFFIHRIFLSQIVNIV